MWLYKIWRVKLIIFCSYCHSKIHNCLLESSLKPEDFLPELLSANTYKITTDLRSGISMKLHLFLSHTQYHAYSIVWHSFKYKYTKQRNACTLNYSNTSKFQMTLAKRSLNYFLYTVSTSILLKIVWSYLIHYLTNFFLENSFGYQS